MLHNSLLRKFSSIRLTEQETSVFVALIDAAEALGKGTTLRAAGGWVRDKLLGNESCDIDIALDNLPGDEFAQYLHDREKANGKMSSIGVVKENPAQSKHIRTASFRFHGLDLDINNLRSETYTEHSRIPEVQFAKHPSEDALRRDFTMNALYYNLNTQEVEDFTGTGLADLEAGIVRTPLPASRTFVDDPLRVLRAIRFATRFGFKLDSDIREAWTHEDVREGLMNKVSRERVGIEISKMMANHSALDAIKILMESGLIHLILTPPENSEAPSLAGVSKKDYAEWLKAWDSCRHDPEGLLRIVERSKTCGYHEKGIIFSYALLLSELSIPDDCQKAQMITRLALKLSSAECKGIGLVLGNMRNVREIIDSFATGAEREDIAMRLGRLIRFTLRDHYMCTLKLALASDESISVETIPSVFENVHALVSEYDLEKCHEWKPIVDGSEIQKLFALKPGKIIQDLLMIEFDMMFRGVRDRDEIHEKLRLAAPRRDCNLDD